MAGSDIKRICLETTLEQGGFLGHKRIPDEVLYLCTDKGTVILPRDTVIRAGSSWQLLRSKIIRDAEEKGIPFEDNRKENR